MSDVTPPKKERKDAPMSIRKETKERLDDLDFVKKISYSKILETLMDFYEAHKPQFEKWNNQKEQKK